MTWEESWDNIIRNIFFKDDELKRLMGVPERTKIMDFIDKYFVHVAGTGPILKDETSRVLYAFSTISETANPKILKQMISFDIYVKNTEIHTADRDRLKLRTIAISDRIKYLLMKNRYVECYRFWMRNDSDEYTSIPEYSRRNLTLAFMQVY